MVVSNSPGMQLRHMEKSKTQLFFLPAKEDIRGIDNPQFDF